MSESGAVPLPPTEVAPDPAGAWSGFALRAFDLAGVSRLAVAEPQRADPARAFWVAVVGRPATLEGAPVPGVRAGADGVPVYPEVPALRFTGVGAEELASRWNVRIECNGRVLTLHGDELARHTAGFLAEVVEPEAVSEVRVVARGPLGSDFRAEFVVVPGLVVTRPDAVLVPGGPRGRVGVRTRMGRPHEVVVPAGVDVVTASVHGAAGRAAELRIGVPSLHWASLGGPADRGMGQLPVAFSAGALADGEPAFLVVRTRMPRQRLALELWDGDTCLQEDEATTAGEEGRWIFPLARFSSTVQVAGRLRLPLRLRIGAYHVDVGEVRADLRVTGLRVIGARFAGEATVHVVFDQERPCRDRVLRFWSLTQPWREPVREAIADGACAVSISRAQEELPPGVYLAEIAVEDGWTALARPDPDTPGVFEVRLGSRAEEVAWARSLPSEEPRGALVQAIVLGAVPELHDDAAIRLAPDALLALTLLHQWRPENGAMLRGSPALAELACLDPGALARALDDAVLSGSIPTGEPLLALALELIPALVRAGRSCPADEALEHLWETCGPLAAILDLPSCGDPAVRARVERALGVDLAEAVARPAVPDHRKKELLPMLLVLVEQVEEIERSIALLPRRILDVDNQARVQFEWILAARHGRFDAVEWMANQRPLVEYLPSLPTPLATAFREARAPDGTLQLSPLAAFPETVHAAALHLVSGGDTAARAGRALRELVPVCPALVSRALVVAALQLHASSPLSVEPACAH